MKLLSQTESDSDNIAHKRKFERREADQCVAQINGKTFPVMNWSKGGALIFVDDRLFAEDETVDITMKFHIQDQIIPVHNKAKVVRITSNRMAVEFDEADETTRHQFQTIIDDITVREFADSQI